MTSVRMVLPTDGVISLKLLAEPDGAIDLTPYVESLLSSAVTRSQRYPTSVPYPDEEPMVDFATLAAPDDARFYADGFEIPGVRALEMLRDEVTRAIISAVRPVDDSSTAV